MRDVYRDELQIQNLIARVAHAADVAPDAELDAQYLQCFTEDAAWEARTRPAPDGSFARARQGRVDIHEGVLQRRAQGLQAPETHSLHVVTTTEVQLGVDAANARSCFLFMTHVDQQPKVALAGHYLDDFVRTDEGWRISRRLVLRP